MKRIKICIVLFCLGFGAAASGQSGIITTVAGNGTAGFSGDGGSATSESLYEPRGIAADASGNLFIADSKNNRIRKVSASGIITTVAGGGSSGLGDGGPATSAMLRGPYGVAVDASGNLFIADTDNYRVRKVSASGIITTVAGNGGLGFSGDGGPATSATLSGPYGVAVDASGNLFIADPFNNRIRKVSASGIITTVAGIGAIGAFSGGFSGDGGPATSAKLNMPYGVAVNAAGNLFIADSSSRIRKVSTGGIITTVVGTGGYGFLGDGGPATSASLFYPSGVAVDASGNLFIADTDNQRIRKVSADGIITTVAGNGIVGFLGDGGLAASASLDDPVGVAVDASGNLFITDANNRVRAVLPRVPSLTASPTNVNVSLIAGGWLSQPIALASPVAGLAWSASASASWLTLTPTSGATPATVSVGINTVSLPPGTYTGSITISNPLASPSQETVSVGLTVSASTASLSVASAALNFQIPQGAPAQSQSIQIGGTGGTVWQATAATSSGSTWLSVSPGAGQIPASLTVSASSVNLAPGTYKGSVTIQAPATPVIGAIGVTLTVSAGSGQGGIITSVAGSGNSSLGDGGPATAGSFNHPEGVAVDAAGNIFIADSFNNRVRKVSASGTITTVAGTGSQGFSGDGGAGPSAMLNDPMGVAVDASGNLYIADWANHRVRKVSASGTITTVAGDGTAGFFGDGGPATAAELSAPGGVAVDAAGNLFIADGGNARVRKVSGDGIITTVAGGGESGPGDGGPATSAELDRGGISGVTVDASGNLFIVEFSSNLIRKVSADGIITTVAGNGSHGFCCDGGPATSASLNNPCGVAVDAFGDLLIVDTYSQRIRKVWPDGIITTVAGSTTTAGFFGDGWPATSAWLSYPSGVAADAFGNLFIADTGNNRIRKVSALAPVSPTPSIAPGGIVPVGSAVATIQPGQWVSIYGTNLASATVTWNGNFPMSLGGTSVTIDGKSAWLSLVSPGQINLQIPNDTATGSVPVVVTTAGGSATASVTMAQFAPSFFLLDAKHVAGIILRSNGSGAYGGGSYDIIGPTGNPLGYATVAAKAGDSIELFAGGLGPTNPPVQAGQAFSGAAPTTNAVKLLINNVSVTPNFAGLSGAGLYQINVTVPAGLGTGDVSLVATVGSAQTPAGVVISVQ